MCESPGSTKSTDKGDGGADGSSTTTSDDTNINNCIWTLNVKWTRTNVSVPVRTDKTMLVSDFKSLAQARYREHNDCRFGGDVPVLIYRGSPIDDHITIAESGAKHNDTLFAISIKPRTIPGANNTGANNTGANNTGANGTGANLISPNAGMSNTFSTLRGLQQIHTSNVPNSASAQYNNTTVANSSTAAATSDSTSPSGLAGLDSNTNAAGTGTGGVTTNTYTPLNNPLFPTLPFAHSIQRNNLQALTGNINTVPVRNNTNTVPVRNNTNTVPVRNNTNTVPVRNNTNAAPARNPNTTQGFYPPTASSGNNANPLFNGMLDNGMMGGMSPDAVQQMMQSPFMQSLMDRPEFVSMLFDSNPALRELRERNPELNHMLNDPQLLRESMEAASNPNIFREAMRSNDRAMSNIEAMPGGFNALRRMYHTVQEPVWEAAVAGMSPQNFSNGSVGSCADSIDQGTPNCNALPNPWSPNRNSQPPVAPPPTLQQPSTEPQIESDNTQPANNPSTDTCTQQPDDDPDDDLYG